MSRTPQLGAALIACARNAIASRLGCPLMDAADHPALHEPGACFVTLSKNDALRGCIGSLKPGLASLAVNVSQNAVAAAFDDPRFPPLDRVEWPLIDLEVSVLGAAMPMSFTSENDLVAQLVPGRDGLILRYGSHQSTFLPSVWEKLPEPRQFLHALKQKAGLPAHFWDETMGFERYTVDAYCDKEGKKI